MIDDGWSVIHNCIISPEGKQYHLNQGHISNLCEVLPTQLQDGVLVHKSKNCVNCIITVTANTNTYIYIYT